MIVQKISAQGKIEVFDISGKNFQWSFENRRTKVQGIDKPLFPFTISNRNVEIFKRSPGTENKSSIKDGVLTFRDEYNVPGETIVAILLPENHIPDIISFKDAPAIPVGIFGQVVSSPPGYVEILFNPVAKICAIILSLNHRVRFGFKCVTKKVADDDFPENNMYGDEFDINLNGDFLNVEVITTESLKLINSTLNNTDLNDLEKKLNELLHEIKLGNKEKSKNLLSTIGSILLNGVSTVSSLTTIADSYKHGDAAQQFIARIILARHK